MNEKSKMRITLTEPHRLILEQKAREFGCTYIKNRGISQLLEKIANDELTIKYKSKNLEKKEKTISSGQLIKININEIADLNGTIANVSQRINNNNGNMHYVKAYEKNNNIIVILEINKHNNRVFEDLKSINLENVRKYNPPSKIKGFIKKRIEKEQDDISKAELKEYDKKDEVAKKSLLRKYLPKPIINALEIFFRFKLEIKGNNKPVEEISKEVAKKQITIWSIQQTVNLANNKNIIDLIIIVDPETSKNVFNTVKILKKSIENLETVEKIYQVDIKK